MKFFVTLCLTFLMIYNVNAYEDNEGRITRFKFYQDMRTFSNGTMDAGVDPFNGLYCKANDFIEKGGRTLNVPKDRAMCPHYIFPFKFELYDILLTIPNLANTLGREQKFSVYLLVYSTLYQLHADKAFVKKYIKDHNLTRYDNLEFEPLENIQNSFPKIILGKSSLEEEHFKLLSEKQLGGDVGGELQHLFKEILTKINQSEHMEAMFHWTSNFEHFRQAYGVVMSRGMTLRINEYSNLVDYKKREKSYKDFEKKNHEINKNMCRNSGCPCIVLYIDLCNHYQPKFRDLRDKRPIILDTAPGYFLNAATLEYDIGDEVNYTYSNDPNGVVMFFHYGFVMPDNIFNINRITINDRTHLNNDEISLCKELRCFENTSTEENPAQKTYSLWYKTISDSLLNYGRVKNIRFFDVTKENVLRAVRSKKPLKFEIELNAWSFYNSNVRGMWLQNHKPSMLDSIKNGQKYRNKRREIESVWRDEDEQRIEWRDLRHFDLIYDLDISYKRITLNHVRLSENKMISLLHNEIMSKVNNYINKNSDI